MEKPEWQNPPTAGSQAAREPLLRDTGRPVDRSMTAALVWALEDLTSAASSQSESLDRLRAGPDQRISGDSVLFSHDRPGKPRHQDDQ